MTAPSFPTPKASSRPDTSIRRHGATVDAQLAVGRSDDDIPRFDVGGNAVKVTWSSPSRINILPRGWVDALTIQPCGDVPGARRTAACFPWMALRRTRTELPYRQPDASVDAAVANMVAHHAREPARMLQEMARVTRLWLGFSQAEAAQFLAEARLVEYGYAPLGMQ